jgi:hypothetical protein
MTSAMQMLYLICKHMIYFLFKKAGGGGGVSMSPYRNKTTPCTGFFFCIPLGETPSDHRLSDEVSVQD